MQEVHELLKRKRTELAQHQRHGKQLQQQVTLLESTLKKLNRLDRPDTPAEAPKRRGRPPRATHAGLRSLMVTPPASAAKRRAPMSEAQKKRISRVQKKRWAKWRKDQALLQQGRAAKAKQPKTAKPVAVAATA